MVAVAALCLAACANPPTARVAASSSAAPSTAAATLPPATVVMSTPTVGPGTLTSQPPTLPPSPTLRAGDLVTNADNGALLLLAVGEQAHIELTPDPAGNWDPPTVDGPQVQISAHAGGYPSSEALTATLTALSTGTALVVTSSDAPCFHTQPPCLRDQAQWIVTVVVTP